LAFSRERIGSASTDFYLSVDLCYLELATENAVAISYTWGRFSQQDVSIGHRLDKPAESLNLNLGLEWSLPGLLHRLVEISSEYGGIWIDQLCLPGKDDDIRDILAKIPTIYRTLNAVVLFPGSLCPCLREEQMRRENGVQSESQTTDDDE
jgi:hypothetical protein